MNDALEKLPKFDSEGDALKYAKRLTELKAGDEVGILTPDNTCYTLAVVMSNYDGPRVVVSFYDFQDKVLKSAAVLWPAIKLL